MIETVRSPFAYFGGKGAPKIKNAILKLLPPHDYYVEPFGGGASILLAKDRVNVEVYNDVNRGLVNFFRTIADPDMFAKFLTKSIPLPVSRELWEEYLRTWPGIHDQIEQAVRWYYVARLSFSGEFGASFATSVNSHKRGMASNVSSWLVSVENLPDVHARMQTVQIECCDWRDILKRFSGPGWLAYCDPPYVSGSRRAGGYAHELKDSDHEELIQSLMKYQGAIVLSGYNSKLYEPLSKAGWDKQEVEVVCSAAGRTRASGLQGAGKAKEKQKRIECIWRNPETMRRIASLKK